MSNSKKCQIKLISESFVRPKKTHEIKPQNYHLGPLDITKLSLDYIHIGLAYLTPISKIKIHTLLKKLKHSLSLALLNYYPLAGRLATDKFPEEHASLIFIDCAKGPGSRILHASIHLNVSDLVSQTGHVFPAVRSLFDLGEEKVNHDGHTEALVSLQVTELLDGIFLGFTMNQAVADSMSFMQFILAVSNIYLTGTMLKKPILKPLIPDGYDPIFKIPYLDPDEFVTRLEPDPIIEKVFHFSRASLLALKVQAKQECEVHNISSFQALSGLFWRSITRARNLEPHEETNYGIFVDGRHRFDPQFSTNYFGNFAFFIGCSCTVSDLLGQNLGWASKMVHNTLKAHNNEVLRGSLETVAKDPYVTKRVPELNSKPNLLAMGGYTNFDIYGPQFGFGKAMTMLTLFHHVFDGMVYVFPGREGGSVNVQVGLRPEIMSALESDEDFMRWMSKPKDLLGSRL